MENYNIKKELDIYIENINKKINELSIINNNILNDEKNQNKIEYFEIMVNELKALDRLSKTTIDIARIYNNGGKLK